MSGLSWILTCIGAATVLWCFGVPYLLSLAIAFTAAALFHPEKELSRCRFEKSSSGPRTS